MVLPRHRRSEATLSERRSLRPQKTARHEAGVVDIGSGYDERDVLRADRLVLLQEVTSELAHSSDLAQVADTVMSTTKGAVGAEAGVLCVI
ncbi:MAG: hypothetical protein ACRDRV_09720, partial [Pseudonocardiaceae bacterium]